MDKTKSDGRKTCFSHWKTTYNEANESFQDNSTNHSRSKIFDIYKPNYHNYHKSFYSTDSFNSVGIYGDKPNTKFFNETQKLNDKNLFYSDNYDLALGTTKTNKKLPGYCGFLPKNKTEFKNSNDEDPYINVAKANHILNYKTRIPRYQGHLSINPINVKGNPRPYCLSTLEEKLN